MTMRVRLRLLAACVVAACGTAQGDDAHPPPRAAAAESAAAAVDTYAFRVHETEPGVTDSVVVTRRGRRVQVLVPSERIPVPLDAEARITRIDLDFDGHADVGLVTLTGAGPNTASDYWRFDPAAGSFRFAGNYPTFQADSAARELTTFNRGGHAGRLWTRSRWRWMDGAPVEVVSEEQTWADDVQRYVRVVRRRRGGALAVVSADTLEEPQVEPGGEP